MLFSIQRLISFVLSFLVVLFTMSMGDRPDTPVIVNENKTNPYIVPYGEPMISAHRIGAAHAPQNTLMAFEYMLLNDSEMNVDIFEFDVQLTLDGELVMLHDLTYDNTSNAKEAFGYSGITPYFHTFEELQCLNLGENFKINGEYPFRGLRGEDIPENLRVVTVETVIDYVENYSDKKFHYIIEVKSPALWGYMCTDKLAEIIESRGLEDRVIIATFMPTVSEYMEKEYPHLTRSAGIVETIQFYYYCRMGYDFNELNTTYSVLQLPYGKNVMPWKMEIVDFGTKQVINYAHANNIAVQYWTVNHIENAQYLTENGADALMGDDPVLLLEALDAIENEARIIKSDDAIAAVAAERNELREAFDIIDKILSIFW